MKENINIIKENVNNLISLWQEAAKPFDGCYISNAFSYCYVKNSDWPNRLWFEADITKNNINAAKDELYTISKTLTVPCWDVESDSTSQMLENSGFKEKSMQVGMSLKLNGWPEKPLRLKFERVANGTQAKEWTEIFRKAFGYNINEEIIMKSHEVIEFYIAYFQESPVGTAIIYHTGDIVGVHGVGIIPEARRQGLAEEIMAFVLYQAARTDRSYITLQASAMGKGLYEKLGFREDFIIKNYILETNT